MGKCYCKEMIDEKKNEIIDACDKLYKTHSFCQITIKDIGCVTSFTRTSIYNYFQTKEDIFLALLQREFQYFSCQLKQLSEENDKDFIHELSLIIESRETLIKILTVNLYDIEENSSIDNLLEFKKTYKDNVDTLKYCFKRFYPQFNDIQVEQFITLFYPMLYGIYPYTCLTKKRYDAMQQAGIDTNLESIYDLSFLTIKTIINGIEKEFQ